MTPRERERFHNLLVVAKESPFAGERRNALAAATRMAGRMGLTLEEAARSGGERYQDSAPGRRRPGTSPFDDLAEMFSHAGHGSRARRAFRSAEARHAREKQRYEEALAAARARGLDRDEAKPARDPAPRPWRYAHSPRRRSPTSHARVLLAETHLSLDEIASISGLDPWAVAGLKLRMREETANPS